jgi:prophage antirepressor-like protein
MSSIQIFDFNSNQVRIQIINNKEYFCAKDVCDVLGYSNGKDAISRHCKKDGVVKHALADALGRMQEYSFISEPNLYRLISHSKLPSAEKFEAWVFEEVLPIIRKTGKFEVQQLSQKEQVLLLAKNLIQAEEENQRLQIENTQKEEVIEKFIEAKEHKNYTQTADIIGMPQKKFLEYLRLNGYVEKNGRRQTVKSKNLKIIETKWSEKGYERFLVTPKGIEYFKRKISLNQ